MKIKEVALWLRAGAVEAQAEMESPALVLTGCVNLDKLFKLCKFHFCIHKMMIKVLLPITIELLQGFSYIININAYSMNI